jgi:hypothetical protein
MKDRRQHLDHLLADWPYEFGEVAARIVPGADGREVLQLRVEMGVLQMETVGRPDGSRPDGYPSCLDWLQAEALEEGAAFELDAARCMDIDREFVQYFHRRVAWLALREFDRAVEDADHTLALMDFSSLYAPHSEWSEMHEQYRPFVLFHRTQAAALATLERGGPEPAIAEIEAGCATIRESLLFDADASDLEGDLEGDLDQDELLVKLAEMKSAVAEHYDVASSLTRRLADAIAAEQYELAAQLRDQIGSKRRRNN